MVAPIRIVVAKPGLDGHDRGAKVIARALRDAGHEVIYTGLHQTPEQIVETAIQEDADVIGLSVLSGAHMTLFKKLIALLDERDARDIVVIGGGIIPEDDIPLLKELGVARVFTPGATTTEIVAWVRDNVQDELRASRPEPTGVNPPPRTRPSRTGSPRRRLPPRAAPAGSRPRRVPPTDASTNTGQARSSTSICSRHDEASSDCTEPQERTDLRDGRRRRLDPHRHVVLLGDRADAGLDVRRGVAGVGCRQLDAAGTRPGAFRRRSSGRRGSSASRGGSGPRRRGTSAGPATPAGAARP